MGLIPNQVGEIDQEFSEANAALDRLLRRWREEIKQRSPEELWDMTRDWLANQGDEFREAMAASHAACLVRLVRQS